MVSSRLRRDTVRKAGRVLNARNQRDLRVAGAPASRPPGATPSRNRAAWCRFAPPKAIHGGATMILVTGAGGNVGRPLLEERMAAGMPVRAAHRSADKTAHARANGHDAVTV